MYCYLRLDHCYQAAEKTHQNWKRSRPSRWLSAVESSLGAMSPGRRCSRGWRRCRRCGAWRPSRWLSPVEISLGAKSPGRRCSRGWRPSPSALARSPGRRNAVEEVRGVDKVGVHHGLVLGSRAADPREVRDVAARGPTTSWRTWPRAPILPLLVLSCHFRDRRVKENEYLWCFSLCSRKGYRSGGKVSPPTFSKATATTAKSRRVTALQPVNPANSTITSLRGVVVPHHT